MQRHLRATLQLYAWADADAVRAAVDQAVAAWWESGRGTLGVDVVRSQLVALLSVYGVYRVDLASPVEDREVSLGEWVDWQDVDISLATERHDG